MQASQTDPPSWPLWLLTALVAALFGVTWWQPWVDTPQAQAPAAQPAPEIAERRPAPPASPPAPARIESSAIPAPAPSLRLVGTVDGGSGSFATVLRTTDSQLLQVRVGDRIDGLTVTAIEPGRVVMAGAAQPIVVEAPPAVAVPPPPLPSRPAASQVEPPNWPEGGAPWDLSPPFQH